MEKSDGVNEHAGKWTMSGCIPLMPTYLAEAGYEGVKKVVQVAKPKLKGVAKRVKNAEQ